VVEQREESPDDVVISVREVRKVFTNDAGEKTAVLEDISFDVHRGETLVVMGGSGCGKSTLLNCMIGEYATDGGTISYRTRDSDGAVDITEIDDESMNRLRRRIGILFQSGALFNSLTLADNVALPLREHSYVDPSIIDIVVTLKLQQVHMLTHRDKFPAQLSGGQKKRAGLARATALDPEILFYDEPSAGLDPVTSSAIDELIMDLASKLRVTSVVVTHEMDSAFRIADRLIMLDQGKVLKIGTKEEYETIRAADPKNLTDPSEQRIHQFLNGLSTGPLTDKEALSEFKQLLIGPTN
jgi:phospholipid/cholesterol/gamma-HCH transport system ATP-binding protein